jgi:hypothetical protein
MCEALALLVREKALTFLGDHAKRQIFRTLGYQRLGSLAHELAREEHARCEHEFYNAGRGKNDGRSCAMPYRSRDSQSNGHGRDERLARERSPVHERAHQPVIAADYCSGGILVRMGEGQL